MRSKDHCFPVLPSASQEAPAAPLPTDSPSLEGNQGSGKHPSGRTPGIRKREALQRPDPSQVRAALRDPAHLVELLGLAEGARRQSGTALTIRCPWHSERTPSCSVRLAGDGTIAAHCFGCGAGGDALSLVAAARSLDAHRDFAEVLRLGAEFAGLDGRMAPAPPPRRPTRIPAAPADPAVERLYAELLRRCPAAADRDVARYLDSRGLLGEVGARWGALPAGLEAQARVRDRLVAAVGSGAWERSGLAHVHRGAEAERPCRSDCSAVLAWPEHRLLIPWRAAGVDGAIATVQRRLVRPARDGERTPRYVFPPDRRPCAPYGAEDVDLLGWGCEVVIVEGAVDAVAYRALSRRSCAERVVLGLPGLSGWKTAWSRWTVGARVFLALDADPAADSAAERIASDLRAAGAADVVRTRPSGAKDWAEMLVQPSQTARRAA